MVTIVLLQREAFGGMKVYARQYMSICPVYGQTFSVLLQFVVPRIAGGSCVALASRGILKAAVTFCLAVQRKGRRNVLLNPTFCDLRLS